MLLPYENQKELNCLKNIIAITYDENEQLFEFVISLPFDIVLIVFCVFILCLIMRAMRGSKNKSFELSKVQLKIAGVTSIYNVIRNDGNIEIAHKIYIELILK